jgi:hypothetical protein
MGKAGAVIVPFMVDKNLSFIFQSSECRGMDDAITVPLKPGPVGVFLFLVLTPFTFPAFHRVGSQGLGFNLFEVLPLDQDAT